MIIKIILYINISFMIFRAFVVDNHINVYPSSYRGRPVTTANVQEYISNIVSKYLPIALPPWQICVIPMIGTTSSSPRTDPVSLPSTSASGNDTEEEQQPTIDSATVRYHFITATATFIRLKCYRKQKGMSLLTHSHTIYVHICTAITACHMHSCRQLITTNQTHIHFYSF